MTAGSVGATAAPRIHAVVQSEVEEVVGCDGHDGGRGEGADDAERGDRPHGPPEAVPADVHPAVEQDQHERDDSDPLGRLQAQVVVDLRDRDERADQQEERGARDREALGGLDHRESEKESARDDEHDRPEGQNLVHPLSVIDPYIFLTAP